MLDVTLELINSNLIPHRKFENWYKQLFRFFDHIIVADVAYCTDLQTFFGPSSSRGFEIWNRRNLRIRYAHRAKVVL